ncbi:MAG: hypothetical protein R2705_10870 [Ilumatobacteraceae bacterium]
MLEKPSDLAPKVQFCLRRNSYTQEICSPLNDFTSTGLYWSGSRCSHTCGS